MRALVLASFLAALVSACSSAASGDGDLGARDGRPEDASALDGATSGDASGGKDALDGGEAFDVESPAQDASLGEAGPLDTGALDGAAAHDGGPIADAQGSYDATSFDAGPIACPPGAVLDLDLLGTRTGTSPTTFLMGNNSTAAVSGPLPRPSCESGNVGREELFRYTPRSSGRIRVSTDYPATRFDTVLWALSACSSGAAELGCNDDVRGGFDRRSTMTATVSMGVPVIIVLAGYAHTTSTATHGPFLLAVTEQNHVPDGGACDPTNIETYCSDRSTCVVGPGGAATCIPDGGSGGLCRTTTFFPCDSNLVCTGSPYDPTSRCVPQVAHGAACDPARQTSVCTPPDVCGVDPGGGSTCRSISYAETALPAPAFIDACALGTHAALSGAFNPRDDGHSSAPIPLPFPFIFYGAIETEIWPTTNGYALFGGSTPHDRTGTNDTIPTMNESAPGVFPFWEDLVLRSAPGSDVCYVAQGTAPNRIFAVEWLDARVYGAAMSDAIHLTVELVLGESDNTIDFIYQRLDASPADEALANGTRAHVGLQAAGAATFAVHTGTVSITSGLRYSVE